MTVKIGFAVATREAERVVGGIVLVTTVLDDFQAVVVDNKVRCTISKYFVSVAVHE